MNFFKTLLYAFGIYMVLVSVECRVTKGGGDGGLSQIPDEENIALSDAETVVVVSHIYRVKDTKVKKRSPKRKVVKKSITKPCLDCWLQPTIF
uniref:Uncharacterized protein n=1 Tax=Trichobilharzia regenti TaxID=157069 RepID=A0AA85K9P8_TRIRE|nr:unnamed protein product [Trichobilharzia regenti]